MTTAEKREAALFTILLAVGEQIQHMLDDIESVEAKNRHLNEQNAKLREDNRELVCRIQELEGKLNTATSLPTSPPSGDLSTP